MDIIKRLKMKQYAYLAVALLVAALAVTAGVKAYQGIAPQNVFESGSNVSIDQRTEVTQEVTETVGGAVPDFSAIDCTNFNGIEHCFYSGGYNEASTTLFAIKNPFNATSVVDFVVLEGRTGSKSADFYVGTSTVGSIPVHGDTATVLSLDMSGTLVNAVEVATTSKYTIKNGNTETNSLGQVSAGAGSLNSVIIGPSDYVVGYASSTYTTDAGGSAPGDPNEDESATTTKGAITGSENTFYGNYGVMIKRHSSPQKD